MKINLKGSIKDNLKDNFKFNLKKLLAVVFVLSLSPLNVANAEGDESTKEIDEDISHVLKGKGTDVATKMEKSMRVNIEKLVNSMLGVSMYLQGVEAGKDEAVDPALNLVRDHLQKFCSKDTPGEAGANSNCVADISHQFMDLKPTFLSSMRIDDEKSQEGAKRFFETIVDPLPSAEFQNGKTIDKQPITLERLEGDAGLRQKYADMLIMQAYLSLARYAYAQMYAIRSPDNKDAQSRMELLSQQSCQRLLNTEWQNNMKAAYFKALNTCDPSQPDCDPSKPVDPKEKPDPAKAATIEIAVMNATQTCLAFETYKLRESAVAIAAAQLVSSLRMANDMKKLITGSQPDIKSVIPSGTGGDSSNPAAPATPTIPEDVTLPNSPAG